MLHPSTTLPCTQRILPSNISSIHTQNPKNPNNHLHSIFSHNSSIISPTIKPHPRLRHFIRTSFSRNSPATDAGDAPPDEIVFEGLEGVEHTSVGTISSSPSFSRPLGMSSGDQAFFLLSFIAFTTAIAFTSLVIAAVPTLFAMKRAATSLAKLSDTVREELPSTMAAIRLSGMEISDLTLELNDLSQEISDGVHKSAQAVQAAEAGIRQIGALARQQTITMIQERANLPEISLRPMVAGAARKASNAVGRATKKFKNLISPGEKDGEEVISSEANIEI